MANFDTSLADSQASVVEPVKPDNFLYDEYQACEESLLEGCATFWKAKSGVMVYRRMRVAEVFSHGCRDMKKSLE